MTTSAPAGPPEAGAQAIADALRRRTVQTAAEVPAVRGANWRLAVVATVNGDGTVATTDGITVRRLASYSNPLVGDTIAITVSASGNWLVWGRWQLGTDSWTLLTVGSGWTAGVSPDLPPAGRLKPDGTVELRGLVRMSSATPPSTALTLPTALRPGANKNLLAVSSYGIAYLQASSGGSITHASRSGSLATSAWVSLDGVTFVQ